MPHPQAFHIRQWNTIRCQYEPLGTLYISDSGQLRLADVPPQHNPWLDHIMQGLRVDPPADLPAFLSGRYNLALTPAPPNERAPPAERQGAEDAA